MNERQIIEYCLRNNISVEQYFILYLTKRRWDGFRQEFVDYTKEHPWKEEEMLDLVRKELLILNGDATGEINPLSLTMSDEEAEKPFSSTAMAEEFWMAYPATFPLGGGGTFIARTGMAKPLFLEFYMEKIGRDPAKHAHVMKQLARYAALVKANKINGHKLSDWVANEMWDTVPEITRDETTSTFKDDV